MKIIVSSLDIIDREQWERRYCGYAEFYNMPMTEEILNAVWSWIFDNSNQFFALIGKDESGQALGLMRCREMPSPLRGAIMGFLDDLYVIPDARGTGCVQALYKALNEFGKSRGWPFVRWITAEDNYRGRASYDKIAQKTHWLTYQMSVK